MRIQVLSDLHLEFAPFSPPDVDASVIICAGDVHSGKNGLRWIPWYPKARDRWSFIGIAGQGRAAVGRLVPGTNSRQDQCVNALQFLLICLAGWINRHQQCVIEYLQEEVKVLREQLGKKPRFTDDQRCTLAAKAQKVGWRGLRRAASMVRPKTLLEWDGRLIGRKYEATGVLRDGRAQPQSSGD